MAKKNGIIIKTPEQIAGIRKASQLTARTLDMIGTYVRAGISTEEIDSICNAFINANGGTSACINYHGFPRYTCVSRNDIICHGIPNPKELLVDGDIVNIDVTTIVDGYFGDASRMYLVGEVSETAKKLVDAARKSLEIGISEVRPGNRFGNIGFKIASFAEAR